MAGDRQITIRFLGDASSALREIDKVQGKLGGFGRGATAAGAALTAGVTAPIVGLAATSLRAAIDFESAFAGVQKTIEATPEQFAALEKSIIDMSTTLPASATEIAAVMEMAGALGVPIDQMEKFTRVAIDLGETTNLSAEDAATALAKIANITGLPLSEIDRMGATLVALGNAGASTEADITDMALRLAAAGSAVGLSQAEVLGFAGALSSLGLEAEGGGTAMSRVWIEIAKAVANGGDELDAFASVAGQSGDAFAESFTNDAAGATIAFIDGLGRIQDEGGNVFQVLDDLSLGEIRVRDALLRSAGGAELLREQLDLGRGAWGENAALAAEAEKRYGTTAAELEVLKNKITAAAIELGVALIPVLKDLMEIAEPVIGMVSDLVGWFTGLPDPVQKTVLGILGFAAIAGPAFLIAGAFALSLQSIFGIATVLGITTIPTLGAAFAALAGPLAIGAAILALMALWTWMDKTYQKGLEHNAMLRGIIETSPPGSPESKRAFTELSGTHAIESPWKTIFGNAPSTAPKTTIAPPPGGWTGGLEGEFSSGGVVPGPTGAPFRALVHGGETILPAGAKSGVTINVFGNALMTASELERMVVSALNDAKQRGALGFA